MLRTEFKLQKMFDDHSQSFRENIEALDWQQKQQRSPEEPKKNLDARDLNFTEMKQQYAKQKEQWNKEELLEFDALLSSN